MCKIRIESPAQNYEDVDMSEIEQIVKERGHKATIHEVISGDRPIRMYFDIDNKITDQGLLLVNISKIRELIESVTSGRIHVATAHCPTKESFHIVVDTIVDLKRTTSSAFQ